MIPTTRWWAGVLAAGLLVILAILAREPLLFAGPIGVGAWILGVAIDTSRRAVQAQETLSIEYTVAATNPAIDSEASVTLAIERPETQAVLPMAVETGSPPGITPEPSMPSVSLSPKQTLATETSRVSFPIAGEFTFSRPSVTMTDPFGLYRISVDGGSAPVVTVQEQSSSIHVGQRGEAVVSAYGEHSGSRAGPGIVPEEIREYVPGDDLHQIDWKTTARLADLYVRETEGESDQSTLVLVDHRARMDCGPAGETMLDYVRSVSTGIVRTAASQADPLALYTIGAEGISHAVQLSTAAQTYGEAITTLHGLTPSGETATEPTRSATAATEVAEQLDTETQFGRVLAPYVSERTSYTKRLRDDPLVGAVQQAQLADRAESLIILLTTDSDPARLTEAVSVAITRGNRVLVLVTPQCLFDTTDLTDLDALYDRYLAFETLRQRLDHHPRVTAFEVAPGARLQRLLAHRRAQSATP